jgi:hypothetical protein
MWLFKVHSDLSGTRRISTISFSSLGLGLRCLKCLIFILVMPHSLSLG